MVETPVGGVLGVKPDDNEPIMERMATFKTIFGNN